MKEAPLDNITVLDCSNIIAGPLMGMYLADFGAEVIKVEHPVHGDPSRNFGRDDQDLTWKWLNRNKKSIAVDLSQSEGQNIVKKIVQEVDILIESFRPGTMESWNLGWQELSSLNSDLVMVRTSGFGQTGKYSEKPGFGTLAEAMSGFAEVTGFPDKPPTLPSLGLADGIAACFSTFAAMFALYWRDVEGGSGQVIDTSLVEPLFSLMGRITVDYSVNGIVQTREGNLSSYSAPRNTYRTKDGKWVAISGSSETIAARILNIVGGDELMNDPRFQTANDRLENREVLDNMIQKWMNHRTRKDIVDIFSENEAACAPVYNIEDIFKDSYFWNRDALKRVETEDCEDLVLPGVFPNLSQTPGKIDHPGATLGQHTSKVLNEYLGYGEKQIDKLSCQGVIKVDD